MLFTKWVRNRLSISDQTYDRWRKEYGELKTEQLVALC